MIRFSFSLLTALFFSIPFLVTSQFSTTERDALLNLKRDWGQPEVLHSWNSTSSPCTWPQIICSSDRAFVTGIRLNNYNLTGYITTSISALHNLAFLDLAWNYFSGNFPSAILNCSNLQYLDLSQNYFAGNVPASIDRLKSLQYLDLSSNNFTADIPATIGNLTQLQTLNLHSNFFNGTYPVEISKLANLENLRMAYNGFLPAVIPPPFGKLNKLKYLWMTETNAIGEVPDSFNNLSSLTHLDLSTNSIEGAIPNGLFLLKNLTEVYLYHNRFSGPIPSVIESSALVKLDLSINELTGRVPEDLGKLKHLEILYLYGNNLFGEIPSSIGLIPSLKYLRIFRNNLSGVLPPELGSHSKLEGLEVSDNQFTGNLPENLCAGGTLFGLVAFNNKLSGPIPKLLGNCPTLRTVQLYSNNFSGEVPPGLWSATNMSSLMLNNNLLSGSLPYTLPWNLTRLEISNNRFSGTMPLDTSSWTSLIIFEASNNTFTGLISEGLTSLPHLTNLALDGNSFSGELPFEITSWKSLTTLNLARNMLSGSIPAAFGSLPRLLYLDLSQNQFTGEIPDQLGQLRLTFLNVSSNKLTGRIPYELDNMAYGNSFYNNPSLCSSNSVSDLPNCHAKLREAKKMSPKILTAILVVLIILLVLAVLIAYYAVRDCRIKKQKPDLKTWKLTSFQRLAFTEISVLSSLTESNVIGFGASGKVYKVAVDREGQSVAVKRIWNDRKSNRFLEKTFLAEIQILGSVRHSNIVKLLCCISSDDAKLLVYEYMKNESLDRWLHGKNRKALDWTTRLRIAIGAAQGLCHMHHNCTPSIIHRDVKSSNILLDEEFNAKVADFGLAKTLLKKGEANTMSAVAGSFGYIAPEYGYTTKVDEKVDVYSFGVVLLELVTGKRPNCGDEQMNLAEWAWKQCEQHPVADAIDEEVKEVGYVEEMITVFKLGIICTSPLPTSRPSMKEVLKILERCRCSSEDEQKLRVHSLDLSPLLGDGNKYISSYPCDDHSLDSVV